MAKETLRECPHVEATYLELGKRPPNGSVTLRNYQTHWHALLEWMRAEHPEAKCLRDVTEKHAATFVAHLQDRGLAGQTANKHITFLRSLFRKLKKTARLTVNPFEEIETVDTNKHSKEPLTVEELKTVVERKRHTNPLLRCGAAGSRLGA